jgi:xanthine dehydrogenase small subunit
LRGWSDAPEAVREWVTLFASPLIRHRATLGGNLATASPIGDGAPLLLALDASIEIASPGHDDADPWAGLGHLRPPGFGAQGEPALPSTRSTSSPAIGQRQAKRRVMPLAEFFTAYRQTRLAPGELIVAIRVPRPLPRRLRFYKVTKRRLDDISTIAAAFAIDAPAGIVGRARVAFGGVAATPLRLPEAEAALEGQPWSLATVARAQDVIQRVLQPLSDHRGSREYRLAMACSLLEKCWWEAQS